MEKKSRMKRAAKLDGVGNVVVEEVDIPELTSKQVLVRTRASLISRGSEVLARYMKPTAVSPTIMGYSAAGVVEEVGTDVTEFSPGDRVGIVAPHAEYAVGEVGADQARSSVVRITNDVSFEEATFLPLTTSSIAWTRTANVQGADTVAILGQGLVGSLMLQVIKARCAARTIVVDAFELRCRMATEFGADAVIDCTHQNPVEEVKRLTEGKGADIVIDCVGGEPGLKSFEQALDMAASRGVIHLIALYHGKPLPLDASKCMGKLIIGGIRIDTPRSELVKESLELIRQNKVRAKEMITHRLDFAQLKEAFDLLYESLGETLGVVLRYE